jgi:predicted Zn-dependent protease
MPDNYASHMTAKFFDFVKENILNTAYSRMLETEADLVGLELAAKACFDVRESSAFWRKFSFLKDNEISINNAEIGIEEEFLSTHPSHKSRYDYLDSIMDNAIKIRDKCKCPKLLDPDPRVLVEQWKQKILEEDKKKRENVVIPIIVE